MLGTRQGGAGRLAVCWTTWSAINKAVVSGLQNLFKGGQGHAGGGRSGDHAAFRGLKKSSGPYPTTSTPHRPWTRPWRRRAALCVSAMTELNHVSVHISRRWRAVRPVDDEEGGTTPSTGVASWRGSAAHGRHAGGRPTQGRRQWYLAQRSCRPSRAFVNRLLG